MAVVDTKLGCVYMQWALGIARVWSGDVKEWHVYGGRLNVQCRFLVKAESGGHQTWIYGSVQGALGTARVWSGICRVQGDNYTRCALITTNGLFYACSCDRSNVSLKIT